MISKAFEQLWRVNLMRLTAIETVKLKMKNDWDVTWWTTLLCPVRAPCQTYPVQRPVSCSLAERWKTCRSAVKRAILIKTSVFLLQIGRSHGKLKNFIVEPFLPHKQVRLRMQVSAIDICMWAINTAVYAMQNRICKGGHMFSMYTWSILIVCGICIVHCRRRRAMCAYILTDTVTPSCFTTRVALTSVMWSQR